jgi:hypothetical protein
VLAGDLWTRRMLSARVAWLIVPLAATLLAGCGPSRPDLVEVSGQVLIDGQPLSIGNIKFVPNGGRASWGKIDENGRFTLTCYEAYDGAIPGTHRVQVSAIEMISASKAKWHAPKKYADFRTSGLEYTITEPTDDVKIELTWDGGKPFVE